MALPVLLVLFHVAAFAQTQVTGRVTDPNGAGLAGVTVTVKGQNVATSTNENGQYTLTVPANATTLVFSSVGFTSREEVLNGRSSINLNLAAAAGNLNEVVVVAYGTRRRGDLTSSVTQVTAKDFQKGFQPSAEQLLVGKVAGLQVTTGGGAAGTGSRIRIRGGSSLNGSNDPLVVIDGVPVLEGGVAGSQNILNTINPNDIESISVLKDASATALYGSRASNGVLIITTKKGTRGKVKFTFNTQASVQSLTKYAPVLSGDQVRDVIRRDMEATGDSTYFKKLGTANTNWQKEIYREAFGTDNTLGASGTIANVLPFRLSGGFTHQEGVLKNNSFERISTALNLSPKLLNDHLSVNLNAKFSNTKNNFSDQGAIGNAVFFDPTQPVLSGDAKFTRMGGYWEWTQPSDAAWAPIVGAFSPRALAPLNPVSLINTIDNKSTVNRFIGNLQLDYKLHFLPDLHLLANVGGDWSRGSGNNNRDSMSAAGLLGGGSRSNYKQGQNNFLTDFQLFYQKEFKSIRTKFDVMVGHTFQEFSTDVYNFPSFSYRPIADPRTPGSEIYNLRDTIANSKPRAEDVRYTDLYRLESYIGRVNFNINDKYLIQGVMRRDASSKLNPDGRVGYFPAVSVAWKLKQEFFKNVNFISDLKLRASWGETGNQANLNYYSYIKRYTQGNQSAMYQFGGQFVQVLRPEGYVEDLRWETTQTTNLGLDFGFLNNRIAGSVDVYKRKGFDMLASVPIAPGANFTNEATKNVAAMDMEGFEVALNTVPVRTKDFNWDLNVNFSYNKRKITQLLDYNDPNFTGLPRGGIGIATGNFVSQWIVGSNPSEFYVLKQVYDQNGKPLEGVYEDLNRDGQVNLDDRYYHKQADPKLNVGFSTSVSYKKFTVGMAAHGSLGNYVFNQYDAGAGILSQFKNPTQITSNGSPSYLETGFRNNSNFQFLSDYFIQNASFLRIDNINLGYDLGRVFRSKVGMRINASIQNVAVITNYKGLDPEIADDFGRAGTIYPRPRVYTLGVNLDF
ncbi:TonB-dependent receptor [Flaviaesturariibacter amylovorans]|uniref:TonB-dependent receptor n=1 Tax=Flaviaesturariibacter amylovorans TaxID=1084520 RepID=A0ABP8HQA7_9BACT